MAASYNLLSAGWILQISAIFFRPKKSAYVSFCAGGKSVGLHNLLCTESKRVWWRTNENLRILVDKQEISWYGDRLYSSPPVIFSYCCDPVCDTSCICCWFRAALAWQCIQCRFHSNKSFARSMHDDAHSRLFVKPKSCIEEQVDDSFLRLPVSSPG